MHPPRQSLADRAGRCDNDARVPQRPALAQHGIERPTDMTDRQIVRRSLLTGTGFGLGGALAAGLGTGLGEGLGAGLGSGVRSAAAKVGPGDVSSQGYWADKGPVRLGMYRKWPGHLGASPDKQLPVLFLVHGSSLSALSSFDLDVPGDDYSMMDVFARYGFDVWTMDHEGFGRSSQTSGTSDIASRVEDLKAAMVTVQRTTG